MDREKALAKNTMIIGIGTFLPKLVSIITLPIMTGYLTKTEYGTYDLVLTLISLILPMATLQIQSAAFRFLVQVRSNIKECERIITNIVCFTLIASFIPIVIISFVIRDYSFLTRFVICLYFLVDIIFQTFQQISRGLGRNTMYSLSTITNSLVNMLMVVLLVSAFHMGLMGVISSLVISNVISVLFLVFKLQIKKYIVFSSIKVKVIHELISYSWPMVPNNLSSWVMTLSDRLLLVLFMGVEVNAVYAVAKKIPNIIAAIQSAFSLAWQENATLSANDKDINEYYSKMFDIIFNLVIGATAVLIGFAPILFALLIKGDYTESYYQMSVLFLGMTFSALASYLAGIYIADKKTKEIGITTTIAAIINFVIDLIAIPLIGMWAASVSTLTSYAILFFYRMWDVKKFRCLTYKNWKIAVCLAILVCMCILSSVNIQLLNIVNFVLGLIIAIGLNVGIIKK